MRVPETGIEEIMGRGNWSPARWSHARANNLQANTLTIYLDRVSY
jgi:hypothetical protein